MYILLFEYCLLLLLLLGLKINESKVKRKKKKKKCHCPDPQPLFVNLQKNYDAATYISNALQILSNVHVENHAEILKRKLHCVVQAHLRYLLFRFRQFLFSSDLQALRHVYLKM